jgi:DNA mismatch endonuclease (patch repair protein)
MSRIRSRNTSLELRVFRFLRREGIHFQKHYKKAAGAPDVALPKKKRAVFIDGDFWHGWKFKKQRPRLPAIYWRSKIEGNIIRDKSRRAALKRNGWKVIRIWEHELVKKEEKTLQRIKEFLLS